MNVGNKKGLFLILSDWEYFVDMRESIQKDGFELVEVVDIIFQMEVTERTIEESHIKMIVKLEEIGSRSNHFILFVEIPFKWGLFIDRFLEVMELHFAYFCYYFLIIGWVRIPF